MKNPHAVALGRLGGKAGGPARARSLSSKRRSAIARKAVLARWANDRSHRMKLAQKIADETGADVGILEHTLRLQSLDPFERLAQGLSLGNVAKSLKVLGS